MFGPSLRKNATFSADAWLLNRAHEKLVRPTQRNGVGLRQFYAREWA
jgi:hypothetical protein